MKFSHPPWTTLSLLLFILLSTKPVIAGPYPKDASQNPGYFYLFGRSCASYCGADNQYCCSSGEACYTNQANIAFCSASGGIFAGGYAVYTTTYTETNLLLRTSTYTSWGGITPNSPQGPVQTAPAICTTSLGESSCGGICCASNQRCAFANSCTAYSSVFIQPTKSATYSAPAKPTSGGHLTMSPTMTVPFQPPVIASGSTLPTALEEHSSLSGGAVAGIVVGVVAGVILLLLICFCCIVKTGLAGLLAALGLSNNNRRSEVRRSDLSSSVVAEKKKGSGLVGILAGALVGVATVLGLKGLKARKEARESSEGSTFDSSYYSDSYTGSATSTASSDRRTRESRPTTT